jgi:hypothetical protein
MLRSFAAKSLLSIAAGASFFLFSPMAPHALAQATSAGGRAAVAPETAPYIDVPTNYTYPETSAGLSACDAEGAYLKANAPGRYIASYFCEIGNPVAGVYNLWLIEYTI